MVSINDDWFSERLRRDFPGAIKSKFEDVLGTSPHFEVGPNSKAIPKILEVIQRLQDRFPEEFMDRLLYSLTRYLELADALLPEAGHAALGYCYFEWLMYADVNKKRYRDHVAHTLRVAYLGDWMLEEKWGGNRKLIEKMVEIVKQSAYVEYLKDVYQKSNNEDIVDDSVIRTAWWLAGLYHDIGMQFSYFVQEESMIAPSYGFFNADVCAGIARRIELQQRSLLFFHLRDKLGGSDEETMRLLTERQILEGKRHGVAAALCLLMWLERIELHSTIDLKRRLAFELAALAAAHHDLIGIFGPDSDPSELKRYREDFTGYKVSYLEEPISFLLVLVDEIQEWGRPILIPKPRDKWGVEFRYYIECDEVRLKQEGDTLEVEYRLDSAAIKETGWNKNFFKKDKDKKFSKDLLDPSPLFNKIEALEPVIP